MRELIKEAIIAKLLAGGDKELQNIYEKFDEKAKEAGKVVRPYSGVGAGIGAALGAVHGKKNKLIKRLAKTGIGAGTGWVAGGIAGRIAKGKEYNKKMKAAQDYLKKEMDKRK